MRVLVVTDVTIRGGVDRYVIDLLRALLNAGHEPSLLLEETTTSSLREFGESLSAVPVRFSALYHRRHDPHRLKETANAALNDVGPEVVHVVCGSPRSCLTFREAAVRRRIPMIITEQQVDHRATLAPEECARIGSTYRAAHRVIFVSNGNAATMAQLVGFDGVSVSVIPNGVDVAHLEARTRAGSRPRPRRDGGSSIMTAARFAPEKRLDWLVRAVPLVAHGLIGQVDIYGEGPEKEALSGLVRELGLDHRIRLHSWVPDIPEQMAEHDLFVLPSTAEGMPYALLEAMACGIPIVASDVPGNTEALGGGTAGALFSEQNLPAMAAAITWFLSRPETASRLARIARERVRDQYDLKLQMQRTLDCWAS